MKKIFLLFIIFSRLFESFAQSVGIGTATPAPSAILDVNSTTKGTLITRMTSAQRKAIFNPELGLLVYDTDKKTIYMFDGSQWRPLQFSTNENAVAPISFSANDGLYNDNFGLAVDIDGDYAVVGAPSDDIGIYTDMGSAYIFKNTNGIWSIQAKIFATDYDAGKRFGFSVSISGDYVIIGASDDSVTNRFQQGSAYVFARNGINWLQQAKLVAGDGAATDHFGTSVAINGDYAIVGSPYDDLGVTTGAGSAYVFVRNNNTWTQQSKLITLGAAPNDNFGYSVDIDGSTTVVGAYQDDVGSITDQGSVYVFTRNGTLWTQQAQLNETVAGSGGSGAINNRLGISVSISGNYIIAGRWYTGAVVFVRNGSTWSEDEVLDLTLVHGAPYTDEKAFVVSISDDIALISDYTYTVNSTAYQGRVWVYKRDIANNWRFQRVIDDDNPHWGESFGTSVSVNNGNIIIGAYQKNTKGAVFFANSD